MSSLTGLAIRLEAAGAMGGTTWGALAATEAMTDNPIAAAGRQLLEHVAQTAAASAWSTVEGVAGGAIGELGELAGGAPAQEPGRIRGRIERVADGDTITIRTGAGEKVKVRLLGIDAPESTTLRRGHAECGGTQAKALMQRLAVEHPRVTVVSDPSQDDVDRYGRRLGYVVPTGGGESFQQQLVRAGWAQVYVFRASSPPARTSQLRAAAKQARGDRRGVWNVCGGSFTRPR